MDDDDNVLYHANRDAGEEESVWNDEVLIRMYDEAREKALRKLKAPIDKETSKGSNDAKNKHGWRVGSPCQAKFSEDGIRYEADIISISEKKGTCRVKYVGYGNEENVKLNSLKPSKGLQARKKQLLDACDELEREKSDETDDDTEQKQTFSKNYVKEQKIPDSSQNHDIKLQEKNNSDISGEKNNNFKESVFTRRSNTFPFTHIPPQMHHSGIPSFVPPPLSCMTGDFSNNSETAALSAMLMAWYMSGYHTGYHQGLKEAKQLHKSVP